MKKRIPSHAMETAFLFQIIWKMLFIKVWIFSKDLCKDNNANSLKISGKIWKNNGRKEITQWEIVECSEIVKEINNKKKKNRSLKWSHKWKKKFHRLRNKLLSKSQRLDKFLKSLSSQTPTTWFKSLTSNLKKPSNGLKSSLSSPKKNC